MSAPARASRVATFLALLGALLVGTSCGNDSGSSAGAGTLVGTVDGTSAYIALVSDGERVAGYLCDGKDVSTWIDASQLDGDSAQLVSRRGEELGEARLSADGATGEVVVDGRAHAFTADAAADEAGLYRAAVGEPGSVEAGWIVLADGSVRGAKTSFIDQEGDFVVQPAPSFIDQEGNLAVDLGAGTGTTSVERLDANFIDLESDF